MLTSLPRWTRLFGSLGAALATLWLLMASLSSLRAEASVGGTAALARPYEPILLPGSLFVAWEGNPLAELALYRYRGGQWEPLLAQWDEVSASGQYTTGEGGLLDANDEGVVMALDVGEPAPADGWPADEAARQQARYAIRITDPLDGGEGWLYLFRSPTLPRASQPPYVAWDEAAQQVTAISYTAAFTQGFLGLADLTLNGSEVDILDRQKLRLSATFTPDILPLPQPLTFNEESIVEFLGITPTLSFPITGPVRLAAGGPSDGTRFYAARYEAAATLPLSDTRVTQPVPGTVRFQSVRTSLDLNDPAATGLAPAHYTDPTLAAPVPIDGLPDAVPTAPIDWYEVTGALGGLVAVEEVATTGTRTTFYLDNATLDPDDTGDGRAFGEAGVRVSNPNGTVRAATTLLVLPPGASGLGATLRQQVETPLHLTVTLESPPDVTPTLTPTASATPTATPTASATPPPPPRLYLPLIHRE